MSMNYANAFWAAQEASFDNGDLFLPADTPTGTMTLAMVNKRKNTLVNRHKRQLQRLCELQSKELQDVRRDFCSLNKDRISQMYMRVHPRSEIGMFEEVTGSEWLQHNQHRIFQSTREEESSEDTEDENSVYRDQLVAFNELVEQLNREQNEMRTKQLNEYENYRLFQMRELQMLNFEITARNSTRPQPSSTPDILQASSIEPNVIPVASIVGAPRNSENYVVSDNVASRPDPRQFLKLRGPSQPASHDASLPPRPSHSSGRRAIPPPPPPPPPPPSGSSKSSELTRDKKRKSESQYSRSQDQKQSRKSSSRMEREDSPRSYQSGSRKRDRQRSSSDNSDREAKRKRRDVRSERLKPRRSPPQRSRATSPRPRSYPKPVPTRFDPPKSRDDNLPPTVAASSKALSVTSKNQSSVAVEMNNGRPEVVRKFMGGKKPREYLGSPANFDDALYNTKKAGAIQQVHTYWEGESSLCFMNRFTHTILGRVKDIEPIIREHFVRSSSNADM
ncbi:unnamed protein product [Umbelopsis ramanniana]